MRECVQEQPSQLITIATPVHATHLHLTLSFEADQSCRHPGHLYTPKVLPRRVLVYTTVRLSVLSQDFPKSSDLVVHLHRGFKFCLNDPPPVSHGSG